MLLKAVGKAQHRELAQQAALHGIKLKQSLEPLNLDDKEREAYDKQAQSAFDRLKMRHKMRGGN